MILSVMVEQLMVGKYGNLQQVLSVFLTIEYCLGMTAGFYLQSQGCGF